jgi:hypothetical protein
MNMSAMSFSGLPPIDIPFRFFASAIIFVIFLAFFVLFSGENVWFSRWHPSMLALTHGFTLGFITPVMMGALLQMLPVVGGIGVKNVSMVGRICHPLHFIGTGLLMWGFVSVSSLQPTIKILAIICLVLSFSYYIFATLCVITQYLKQRLSKNILSENPTLIAITYSLFALFITFVLGVILQSQSLGLSFLQTANYDKSLTNIHALWGGLGWMALLILAVSLQVIPMFHVAPTFSKYSAKFIPCFMFITLIVLLVFPSNSEVLLSFLMILFVLFNGALLKVIWRRKRKIPDTTISCWRLAAVTMILIVLFYFSPEHWLSVEFLAKKSMLLSAAFIYFYLLTIILGMLLKILPFLSYTHLQQRCLVNFEAMKFLPNMHELLSKRSATTLFYCHVFAGITLLLTIINPQLYWLFSIFLLIEFSLFFMIILKTCKGYYRCSFEITQLENKAAEVN